MDTVLARILDLLSEKGITDKKFCLDNSFSLSTVSDWKSERNQSYKKHIQKIAQYLHVSTDYLLGNEQKNSVSTLSADTDSQEVYRQIKKLPPEKQKQVFDYVRFLAEQKNEK